MDRYLECPQCGFRRRINVGVLASGNGDCPRCAVRNLGVVRMAISPPPEDPPGLRPRPGH